MKRQPKYAEWYSLDGTNFRDVTVYEKVKWGKEVDFDGATFAGSPFGGPIALAHDKDGKLRTDFPITLHIGSGTMIGRIQWKSGELIGMFWTNKEELVCLQRDGKGFIYNMHGMKQEQFSMGQEALEMKVVEWKTFLGLNGTTGLAVLTSSHRLFITNDVYNIKLWRSHEIPKRAAEKPSCWTVMAIDDTLKAIFILQNEIFLSIKGKDRPELILPNVTEPVRKYVDVTVCPDHKKVAFLTEKGRVQVLSSDFKRCIQEGDSDVKDKISRFGWCGPGAVYLLHSGDIATLFGMEGGIQLVPLDDGAQVLEEVDCLRVLSNSRHLMIQEVPPELQEIHSIGAITAAYNLYRAYDDFLEKSIRTYDSVKLTESNGMEEAVNVCVQAAAHEWPVEDQTHLMKAASFGKSFGKNIPSDKIVEVGRKLRVLNNVRHRIFGIALSWTQLEVLTIPVLLDRLIARGQWPLAIECAQYLRLPPAKGVHRVLSHWAAKMIETEQNRDQRRGDKELANIISIKFRQYPGISYADVASRAAKCNLKVLANTLLEKEPEQVGQVNLLLTLENYKKALAKASENGDPNIINFVLLHLRNHRNIEKMSRAEFLYMLREYPKAMALYKQYCREESREKLMEVFKQESDYASLAQFHLADAAATDSTFDVGDKVDKLAKAEKCLASGKEDFLASQVSESMLLLNHQQDLEKTIPASLFIGSTLRETIMELIKEKDPAQKIDSLRKEFKISDRQFWHWKVQALAETRDWPALETFSKSKKSPIGYIPFMEAIAKHGNQPEAQKYLTMVPKDLKVKALIKIGMLEEAAKMGFEQNDEYWLNQVYQRCKPADRALKEQINDMKTRIKRK